MRLVHRYLLGELLLNGLFTFLVLASVICMLLLSIVSLKTSAANLSVRALLEVVALLAATQLNVLLPLTVLIATIWTYGRAHSDGEITAMRGAGIRLYHLLVPALVLGAAMTLVLAWVQDEVIPSSHYRQLVIGKRHLAESIEALLKDRRNSIEDPKFKCTWQESSQDEDGFLILRDVVVAEMQEGSPTPLITRAKTAQPRISDRHELVLELRGFQWGEQLASDSMTIRLDLHALSEEPPPRRKASNRTYEELITFARRHPDDRDGRRHLAELHKRAATALSALLFALFGAPLGLVLRISNRAYVFGIGFLLVLVLYYGPILVGESLAWSGAVAPWIGLWVGDGLILILTAFVLRKAFRR